MNKIVHCITTIERGGAENQLLILAREQIRSGNKVYIVYLKGKPELEREFLDIGAEVIDILLNKNILIQVYLLFKYIRSENFILHAHLPRAELISFLCNTGSKLIITRHNAEPFYPRGPKLISKLLSRIIISRSNRCIAISYAVKDYIIRNKEINKKNQIDVVYYGFDNTYLKISSPQKHHEKFVIGSIGRLTHQKDQSTLLRSFAQYAKHNKAAQLLLVGDGELKQELQSLSKELGVFNKIVWVGKVSNVYKYLSIMDVFILPSIYEGFGMVLLEAMQAGVIIIAANNSAIPEVLGKHYPGLFQTSNATDLLDKIIKSESKFFPFDISDCYLSNLEKFDPSKMAAKIDAIYNSK